MNNSYAGELQSHGESVHTGKVNLILAKNKCKILNSALLTCKFSLNLFKFEQFALGLLKLKGFQLQKMTSATASFSAERSSPHSLSDSQCVAAQNKGKARLKKVS